MEDVRNEREFSPPEIHWREALKRMNREIRKVQSLPPVENLLETTPIIIKSSLEIREKYFNKKNEDLIRKARGIFDNPIPKNTYDLKNIISLCYADIMFLNDDDELVIYECKYLKPWDFPFEFVSATIMEECIGFHKINIIDLIRTFFCQDRLISIKQKINVDPSKPKRKYNNYSKTKINGTSAETSDWRSELKNRGKFVKTKILEEIDLGVPEYKPPFRSSAIVMDWRDVMKSQMENAEENDPFLKWNKLDPSPNKSKTRIKLKSPNQKTRIAAERNKFSENSNDSIFGAKIKLRPSNKDRPLAKQSVKKKTTKIINFVAISVTTEEEKVIDEIDHSPMTPKFIVSTIFPIKSRRNGVGVNQDEQGRTKALFRGIYIYKTNSYEIQDKVEMCPSDILVQGDDDHKFGNGKSCQCHEKKASETQDKPSAIYAEFVQTLDNSTKAQLKDQDSIKRTLRNQRAQTFPPVPSSLLELRVEVFSHCQDLNFIPDPATVIQDFEQAAIQAVRLSLDPEVQAQGYFYHLTQSTWRKVQELGLTNTYKQNQELRQQCPPNAEQLLSHFDATCVGGINRFAHYHAPNDVRGVLRHIPSRFPPTLWNVDRATITDCPRTNNQCEGWNSRFFHLVGHHDPLIWKCIQAFQKEESTVSTILVQEAIGQLPKKKRKRIYIEQQQRLKNLCESYVAGHKTICQFLSRAAVCKVLWTLECEVNALSLAGKRSFSVSCVATSKGSNMSDPKFHATGLEKYEILAAEAGKRQSLDTYLIRPETGQGDSAKTPIRIPSIESSRIVGCSCESDFKDVVWFNLNAGEPQQCDCGVYFKLFHHNPLQAKHIVKATKEEPHIVDALDEYRMVGCLCNEHDTNIKWMWLFENKPKRCRCGHWFKLKKHAAPDRYEMPL
ncbi:unnamed protein product [Lepeophtheirus salmonis]|uniref:(salmon louse) hypothetical protein n=1 Tax=Lepeophtheirus salmonis TaxID=72036 RepID=A0A7R8CT96_LEPSM|nr:unnamed protein product [Lepeophtheirus salmonis]CAF2886806.1 unnamed protein product [Lepeophtheirus salmonis]